MQQEPLGGVVDLQYTLLSEVQSQKASCPIDAILEGIIILVRLLHSENAKISIETTLSGIITLESDLQPWYLQPIITQYFIDNKSEIWLLFLIAHSKR